MFEAATKIDPDTSASFQKSPRVTTILYLQKNEDNLLRCLTSLTNQILDDLEIICIDDSSDDIALKDILNNYAKKEPRLKIAHTKNAGFGRSVNQGIKFAHGEYLYFINANDYLDPAAFIELFALAKKHDADLVRSNYYDQLGDRKDILHEIILSEEADRITDPSEATSIFYQPPALWATLYKKDYLLEKKLFFQISKDAPYTYYGFNFKTLVSTAKIVLSDKSYAHHREIDSSTPPLFSVNEEFNGIETFLKDKILWKTYTFVFQAIKFNAYYQHMTALSKKQLEKFVLRTRAEFHDADNHRLLAKHYFPKDKWRALRTILDLPESVFLTTFKLRRPKTKNKNSDKEDQRLIS